MKHRGKVYYFFVFIIFFLGVTIINTLDLPWPAYFFFVIFGMLFDSIWYSYFKKRNKEKF